MRVVIDSSILFSIIVAGMRSEAFKIIKNYDLIPLTGVLMCKRRDESEKYLL